MITWDYFVKVRRLKVKEWLENRDVKSYSDFLKRLKDLGISPVPEDVFLKMVMVPAETSLPELSFESVVPSETPGDFVVTPQLDEVIQETTDQAGRDVTLLRKKRVRKETT